MPERSSGFLALIAAPVWLVGYPVGLALDHFVFSHYTFYDTMAGYLIDMAVMCEPDSREPWFICEAHAQGDTVDRVVSIFESSLQAALEARAHGEVPVHTASHDVAAG